MENQENRFWGIILAGGEGRRLQDFTRSIYGVPRPKQFCAFTGTRSLFRHTVDRIRMFIQPEKILTVINRNHRLYADDQLADLSPETIIELPCSRETAPSILLSLLKIEHHDPKAIVGIFPSDHHIVEEQRFINHVRTSFAFVHEHPLFLVLHGVDAAYPETEYGWIETGGKIRWSENASFLLVKQFWEKPSLRMARILHVRNCLWNTLILVGRVQNLLGHFRSLLPELYRPLREIVPALETPGERQMIDSLFEDLPTVNFSTGLLKHIPHLMCVSKMSGIQWNDWGDRWRIESQLGWGNIRTPEKPQKRLEDRPVHV